MPELPFYETMGDDDFFTEVQALADAYAREEHEACRRQWKQRARRDPAVVRAFVKRRADQLLEWEAKRSKAPTPTSGRHPAREVQLQENIWMDKWTTSEEVQTTDHLARVDAILEHVPRPVAAPCDFRLTPETLKQAVRAMKHKAAGPDHWSGPALLALPWKWWVMASRVWDLVLDSGVVPDAWARGRTVLLFKPNGKTRPLTILPLIWRAGARCLNCKLKAWCDSWRSHRDAGGLPATSVGHALQQLQLALNKGMVAAVQQDVAGYFDCLEHHLVDRVLRHLRAPPGMVSVLADFYQKGQRIFKLEGALGSSWRRPTRGIPQGCPFSPVISAALTHIWSVFVVHSGIDGMGFIDDRSMWLRGGQPFSRLEEAVERSTCFDEAFHLELNLGKCAVAAKTVTAEVSAFADGLGYGCADSLDILGVVARFEEPWSLLKFSVRKVVLRLQLLRSTRLSDNLSKALMSSLITPCYSWAAAFASPDPSELAEIRQAVLPLFSVGAVTGIAKVLMYEVLGWELEPQFAIDKACLRAAWHFCVRPPGWMEERPLAEVAGQGLELLPTTRPTLARLGWWLESGSSVICRRDDMGAVRRIYVGHESFAGLYKALVYHYRQLYLSKADRLWRPRPRDVGCAVGLDLPAPPQGLNYEFEGHKAAYYQAGGQRSVRLAALGAGASCWHFNAGNYFPSEHRRWRCVCGGDTPSRPHLSWTCASTAPFREGCTPPVDRAQERLLARALPQLPVAPLTLDEDDFLQEVAMRITGTWQELESQPLYLATDGSSKHEVGAWAIVVHEEAHSYAMGDGAEDQSPFRMEVRAICATLSALERATADASALHGSQGRCVYIVSDCKAAISALSGYDGFDLRLLLDAGRRDLQLVRCRGFRVEFTWVPSHDKRQHWCPPAPHDAGRLRALNRAADLAAGACMARRCQGSLRQRWHQLAAETRRWEEQAIALTAKAAEMYHAFLKTWGLRPSEFLAS